MTDQHSRKWKLDAISTHPDLQIRVKTDQDAVERYAQLYTDGEILPPVSIIESADGTFYLIDGHHRFAAAQKAGLDEIDAVVAGEKQTFEEMLQAAIQANSRNGLALTSKDRQRAAELLITARPDLSLRQIAQSVGVSKSSVENYIRRLLNARMLVKCKYCSTYTAYAGFKSKGWEQQGEHNNSTTFFCPKCAPKKEYLKMKADCDFHTQYLHKCTNCGMTAEAEIYMTDETIQIVCSCGLKSGKYKRAYDAVHTWNRMNPKIESKTASKYPADEESDAVSKFPADEEPDAVSKFPADEEPDAVSKFPADEESDAVSEFPADEESDAVSKSEEPDDEEQDDEEQEDDEELELKRLEVQEMLLEYPCPKCGKEPAVAIFHAGRTQIKCPDKECSFSGFATIYPTAEKAVEVWIDQAETFQRNTKAPVKLKSVSQTENEDVTEMKERLKPYPCPFCGCVPQVLHYPESNRVYIECRNDSCEPKPSVTAETLEDAFEIWIRRPSFTDALHKFLKDGYRWTLTASDYIQLRLGRYESYDVLYLEVGTGTETQRQALALPKDLRKNEITK